MLPTLQSLFKNIIENGVSTEHAYFILATLTIFVASACGAYFGEYFRKRGEERAIRVDFDEIKKRLSQTTKLTEDIKASINISTIEHQIMFSRYHEKRIEVTEKIFELLINIQKKTSKYLFQSLPYKDNPELFNEYREAVSEFLSYYSYKKYWIDEELSIKVYSIALEIEKKTAKFITSTALDPSEPQKTTEAIKNNIQVTQEMNEEIRRLIDEITKTIRNILEPKENFR